MRGYVATVVKVDLVQPLGTALCAPHNTGRHVIVANDTVALFEKHGDVTPFVVPDTPPTIVATLVARLRTARAAPARLHWKRPDAVVGTSLFWVEDDRDGAAEVHAGAWSVFLRCGEDGSTGSSSAAAGGGLVGRVVYI